MCSCRLMCLVQSLCLDKWPNLLWCSQVVIFITTPFILPHWLMLFYTFFWQIGPSPQTTAETFAWPLERYAEQLSGQKYWIHTRHTMRVVFYLFIKPKNNSNKVGSKPSLNIFSSPLTSLAMECTKMFTRFTFQHCKLSH